MFWKNKKTTFKGNVTIGNKEMPASGDAILKKNGTYELSGAATVPVETRTPVAPVERVEVVEVPRHGGCDEDTLHRMEKRVTELI